MHVIDAAFVTQSIGKDAQHTVPVLVRYARDLAGNHQPLILVGTAQPHPDHGTRTGAPLLVVDPGRDIDERQVAHDVLLPGHGPDTRPRHTFVVLFKGYLGTSGIRPGDMLARHGLETSLRAIGQHIPPVFHEPCRQLVRQT